VAEGTPVRIEDLCAVAVGSLRPRDEAERLLPTLLGLMGWTAAPELLGPQLRELLVRYCMDVPLNISWYVRKLEVARRRNGRQVGLAIAGGVAAIAVAVAVPLLAVVLSPAPQGAATLAADVTVIAIGLLGIGQVLASRADVKAQIGAFWTASSGLKEHLLDFVETWRGRLAPLCPGAGQAGPDPAALAAALAELRVALVQELKAARIIAREERAAFFATFRSPSEVLAVVSSAFEGVRGRQAEALVAARQLVRPEAQTNAVTTARRALLDARAASQAARAYHGAVKAAGVDPRLAEEAQVAALRAQAEEIKAQATLDAIVAA
jgi:hypothetical protein